MTHAVAPLFLILGFMAPYKCAFTLAKLPAKSVKQQMLERQMNV